MKISDKIMAILNGYLEVFSKEEGYFEDDIRVMEYFNSHADNTDVTEVVLKISAVQHPDIDHIIKSRSLVAKHIVALHIDKKLPTGDPQLVNDIAKLEYNHKTYFLYPFASRYCNYHYPDKYPIYDSLIEKILKLYFQHVKNEVITKDQIMDYSFFKKCMLTFREDLEMSQYNFKEIDKFIWIYGDTIIQEASA